MSKFVGHCVVMGVKARLSQDGKRMFRNAVLLKPPEVGSQKGWHQDSPYWPIEPMALCSCWLPFDDATPENGCMQALRGELSPPRMLVVLGVSIASFVIASIVWKAGVKRYSGASS